MKNVLAERIFSLHEHNDVTFEQLCLELFRTHAEYNTVYRDFIARLGVRTRDVRKSVQIPFLPISFFKHHRIRLSGGSAEAVFLSSRTTGNMVSSHHVAHLAIYERSLLTTFRHFFGDPQEYCILALLPSYLDRSGSSLVHMMKYLMDISGDDNSGFYLDRLTSLSKVLQKVDRSGKKILLAGVTFALIDLAEKHPQPLKNCTVLETGGMKGRRREMPREEVHDILKNAFKVEHVASEYGMTELLSQAYALKDGIFWSPPWMRTYVREMTDPLSVSTRGKGAFNIIDLANMDSCPFIATDDIGHAFQDGSFDVIGRMDNSEMRGCNLMVM